MSVQVDIGILYMVIREGLSDKVTFVQLLEGKEKSKLFDILSKSIPGGRKSMRALRLENS